MRKSGFALANTNTFPRPAAGAAPLVAMRGQDSLTQFLKLSTEKIDRKIFVSSYSPNKNISNGK